MNDILIWIFGVESVILIAVLLTIFIVRYRIEMRYRQEHRPHRREAHEARSQEGKVLDGALVDIDEIPELGEPIKTEE